MRTWQGICLTAVLLISLANTCGAQSVTPADEYKKLIKIDQDIQPLGAHPFGEQIDLSLSGNGPTMQLSRSFYGAI